MTLSDLASMGTFVSAVAVVISLVYLALQVRHAEKTQRALMHQARAERVVNASLASMQPDIAEVYSKVTANAALSPREMMQVYYYMRSQVAIVEDAVWQHEAGFLDRESLETAILNFQRVMLLPSCRAAWLMLRPQLSPTVCKRFDDLVADALAAPAWNWAEDYVEANAQVAKRMTPLPPAPPR